MATRFTRHPFQPEAIEDVLAFARANDIPPHHPQSLLRRFLTQLVSCPERVIDLHDDEGRAGVAVVLDRVQNVATAAPFEVIGVREEVAEDVCSALLAEAEKEVPPRYCGILATYHFTHPFEETVFTDRGFEPYFSTYAMIASPPIVRGLSFPAGLKAELMRPDQFTSYYQVVREAFAKSPDVSVPDENEMRTATLSQGAKGLPPVLLHDGDQAVGFASLKIDPLEKATGEVHSFGVLPSHRGQGLGKTLLDHSLQLLRTYGAHRVKLSVAATNTEALGLYRQAGFQVADRYITYLKKF